MKASSQDAKRSSIGMRGLLCVSLLAGGLLSSCSDAKDQDPAPQNDTLYALPASVNAEVRDTFQLGAQRLKGGLATNVSELVTWQSSDANVVTVDATGKAVATGIGSATVSTSYEGFPASVNVKVTGRITSAEVEPAPIRLAKGTMYKLATIGIVEDFSKRALTGSQAWGSSNPGVATSLNDGTVVGAGAGTATIALTYKNVSYPRDVTVVDLPLDSVTVTSDNGTTVPTGAKTTFRVVGSFGGGAMTQNITNLCKASVSTKDAEFATAGVTDVTARGLPKGAAETTVVATIAGAKGTIAETVKQDVPITIIDSKSLSSLAIAGVPSSIAVNAEPFTPTFKGTYGATEFTTTSPTLSFKPANADDKTKYVEIITGMVYPRVAGTVSIMGTVDVPVAGQTQSQKVTASADVQIVDAPLVGVTLASAEMMPTTTVGVDKTIRFSATADYGGGLTQTITSAVVWVSAKPNIAMVANAAGTFGAPGRVTGVSEGAVDIQAYYRGKLAATVQVTVVP
jgi:trimeric autotransporter adhesin